MSRWHRPKCPTARRDDRDTMLTGEAHDLLDIARRGGPDQGDRALVRTELVSSREFASMTSGSLISAPSRNRAASAASSPSLTEVRICAVIRPPGPNCRGGHDRLGDCLAVTASSIAQTAPSTMWLTSSSTISSSPDSPNRAPVSH